MTGQQVLEQALALLNYTGSDGRFSSQQTRPVWSRALFVVNQAYRDLWNVERDDEFVALAQLAETLRLSARAVGDVLPYGVAMLLAQGEGDGDNQAVFSSLYAQKRASLARTEQRQDALPRVTY